MKRRRASVTQGSADVLINGKKVMSFGDEIVLLKPGDVFYGENIGNWASVTPDLQFIIGAIYHPFDNIYHYSNLVKKALEEIQTQEKSEGRTL